MVRLPGVLVVLIVTAAIAHAQCTNPIVRREWNQLSTAEKNQCNVFICFKINHAYITYTFLTDVAAAKASASSLTGSLEPGKMSLYDLVSNHVKGAGVAHGNAQFYPFHRYMMYLWETTLAANGWAGGAVYWDWSAVSQNWWQSDVFNYFGSSSRPADNCVIDGPFAMGQYAVSPNPAFGSFARNYPGGDEKCLRRCYSNTSTLDTPESIAKNTLEKGSYNDFRGDDFAGYHGFGHTVIGGSCDLGLY
jgi:hypothetical protein